MEYCKVKFRGQSPKTSWFFTNDKEYFALCELIRTETEHPLYARVVTIEVVASLDKFEEQLNTIRNIPPDNEIITYYAEKYIGRESEIFGDSFPEIFYGLKQL